MYKQCVLNLYDVLLLIPYDVYRSIKVSRLYFWLGSLHISHIIQPSLRGGKLFINKFSGYEVYGGSCKYTV